MEGSSNVILRRVFLFLFAGGTAATAGVAWYFSTQDDDYDRPKMVIFCDPDAVDVSEVDLSFLGHSYYGSNRSVLSDMFELVKLNDPPSQRNWLVPSRRNGYKCWRFVDKPPEVVRITSSKELR